jgi:hypothetical protein
MWCAPVKFGGDSGAVRQVSDIGGGFERVSFTVRSRACHGIRVKREIIIGAASLRTKGGGESFVPARRFLDPRSGYISAPNARLSHLRGACLTCRRTSAAPRVAFDSSANRRKARPVRPRQAASRIFPRANARPGPGACFPVFQKNRKIQERAGGLHGSTETRNDVSCRWPTGGLRRAPVA